MKLPSAGDSFRSLGGRSGAADSLAPEAPFEAFFLPVAGPPPGQRFCIYHPAAGAAGPRAAVVCVHPFAEEMNKSRRMLALQARALAAVGFAVLQIDLLGCGDSSGDFGDASWQGWIDDVAGGCAWLQQRAPAPLCLWGLRAGCLLAAAAAQRLDTPCHLIFWQPPAAGRSVLQQFLRLALAAHIGGGKAVMEGLRRQLDLGAAVDIAGYRLGAALALGLQAARLEPPARAGRLDWIEISSRAEATLLPASLAALAEWRQAGWSVRSGLVEGPAFWQTVEIEEVPKLIEATLAALQAPPVLAAA